MKIERLKMIFYAFVMSTCILMIIGILNYDPYASQNSATSESTVSTNQVQATGAETSISKARDDKAPISHKPLWFVLGFIFVIMTILYIDKKMIGLEYGIGLSGLTILGILLLII